MKKIFMSDTSPLLGTEAPKSVFVFWKPTIAFFLILQFSAFSLIRSRLVVTMCDTSILFYSEVIKLVVSIVLVPKNKGVFESWWYSVVPVVCFMLMNRITMWALRHVNASLFVVLLQLKMLTTALFSWAINGARITLAHFLDIMALGLVVATLTMRDRRANETEVIHWKSISLLVLETFLSGFAAAYTQRIFEKSYDTMWSRNVQMSLFSAAAWGGLAVYDHCTMAPSSEGALISMIGASGGILVALTVLYLGAVEKTIITALSAGVTIFAEMALGYTDTDLSKILLCGAVVAISALYSRLPS